MVLHPLRFHDLVSTFDVQPNQAADLKHEENYSQYRPHTCEGAHKPEVFHLGEDIDVDLD